MLDLTRQSSVKYSEYWVARVDGKRVGKIYTQKDKKTGRIYVSIFLGATRTGAGVGTAAMKTFMRKTQHKEVYAVTRKGNHAMRRVLQKLGWKPLDEGSQATYYWSK
jgi:RimJ/RimL family protein N-acetyltransferase